MKDFLLLFTVFVVGSVSSVFVKNEELTTKPPRKVEELPWLSFFDHQSNSENSDADNGQRGRERVERQNLGVTSISTLCPPGETGQFPYPPDCKRFINCWKGRGSIQVCAPGTLFNSETFECDFPGKVKCADEGGAFGDQLPMPTRERYVRFPHQRPDIMHNPRIARRNQITQSKPETIPAKPYPGRPPYFGPSHLNPPTRPSNQSSQLREIRPQCSLGATGLYPHPTDCTKFLKCWSGNTFIQNCGPGTYFNPFISACDHPRNVPCTQGANYEPGDPGAIPDDLQLPEETVIHEQYQDVKGIKGGKKTEKPTKENQEVPVPTTPQSEVDDLEPSVKVETSKTSRKPKVINIGGPQQKIPSGEKEPAAYLTPPKYDVYGNPITINGGQPLLGVQPGQTHQIPSPNQPGQGLYLNQHKISGQSDSMASLSTYPPQGPYSMEQLGSQDADKTKNYYGYLLNKKYIHPQHPVHPVHPHHPHHIHMQHPVHPVHPLHPHHSVSVPTMFLQPPPFQQHYLYYAPSHAFFPYTIPQGSYMKPQVGQNPYYQSNPCLSKSTDPSAPACEPGTSFYTPASSNPSSPSLPQNPNKLCSKSEPSAPECDQSSFYQPNTINIGSKPGSFPQSSKGSNGKPVVVSGYGQTVYPYYIQQSSKPGGGFQPSYSQIGGYPQTSGTEQLGNTSPQQFGSGYPPQYIGVYPQQFGSVYPQPQTSSHQTSGTTYTQQSGSGHSQQSGSSYPQQTGNSYPQKSGSTYPQQSGTKHPQLSGSTQPQQSGSTYPEYGSTYPQQSGSTYPEYGSTYPQQSGTKHPQLSGNTYPQQSGSTYPEYGSTYPQQSGTKHPQLSGSTQPQQSGSTYPEYGSTYPQQSGTNYPQQSGSTYPQQSGSSYSQQTGSTYPQQSGTNYPQQSGSKYPQQSGSTYPQKPGSNYPQHTGKNDPKVPEISIPQPGVSTPKPVNHQTTQPDTINIPQSPTQNNYYPDYPYYPAYSQYRPIYVPNIPDDQKTNPQTSNYSPNQISKSDTINPSPTPEQGQVTIPDPGTYVSPDAGHQTSEGQVQVDPLSNNGYIDLLAHNKQDPVYPTKTNEDIKSSPSSINIVTVEPPKETATFPPFPGHTKPSKTEGVKTSIKTPPKPGVITKEDPPREYILDKIDLRTKEESDDAERITSARPPKHTDKVDESFVKETATTVKTRPNYPKESNSVYDVQTNKQPDVEVTYPTKSIKSEGDFDSYDMEEEKPVKVVQKPYVKIKQTPPNGQVIRLRNGASHLDGYLEMKDSKSKWGLVCDESGSWQAEEATVACRELGFLRGAELSWQGYPIKSDDENLFVAVHGINCTGKESSLSECKITHSNKKQCDIARNAVGVRCYDNLASHCQPGEILYNQHCYRLHGKENPDDPGIKTEEASEECKIHGGKLVDITSQYENDFISEWLIKKHPDVTSVATGGIGISVLGRPMWLWEGTSDPMVYERWWSGWSGDQNIPKGSINGPLCIILKKTFACSDGNEESQKIEESDKDEETCSADYFFWDVEDCEKLRTSVFICERPMDDIGCVVGNGEGYVGTANTTASGLPCLPWDHPKVVEGLARRGAVQERSGRLAGHNYCRNLGNPDRHPWCFVEGKGNSEYCAIPQCWDSGNS